MPTETRARDAVSVQEQRIATPGYLPDDHPYVDRALSTPEKHLAHAALTNTPSIGVERGTSIQTYAELVKALAFLSDAYTDALHKKDVAQAELAALQSDVAGFRRLIGTDPTTIGV